MNHFVLLENEFSDIDFHEFSKKINWQQNQIKIFGKTHLEPRLTQWFGPPYSYSSINWPEKEMPDFLLPLLRRTEKHCNFKFNAALLNFYRNGLDSMGWHADDEAEIDQSCIASISLGAPRKFKVRMKKDHSIKQDLTLSHGSLLIMNDAQKDWQHSVPKTKKIKEARINITFRKILQ